jgi:osmotically-inducible protein OsmY
MTTTLHKTDAEIKRDVMTELRWDSRVNETEVGVQVKQGIVTLVGKIPTYAEKQAACEAAHRVAGVLDVANDLEVTIQNPWLKTDAEIAQAIRHALEWDAFVPDTKIKSTVATGWVTLEGEVDSATERTDAARVVERLNSVRGVTNNLTVKARTVDAAKIRSSIEEALKRQSEREAKRIDIRVDGSTVKLSGSVHSWAEKNAIEQVACFSPGVSRVENKLVIDTFSA